MCAAMGRDDENKLAMATGPEQRWQAPALNGVPIAGAGAVMAGAVMAGAGTGMELVAGCQL